jgi:hypothetical protein
VEEDFYSVEEAARILKLTPAAFGRCLAPASLTALDGPPDKPGGRLQFC